jgi:protein-disulfide isomerase
MHHRLFERLEQWAPGNDPEPALGQLAADLDLDRSQFSACLQSRKALERVLRDLYEGQEIGVRNIPTLRNSLCYYQTLKHRVLSLIQSPRKRTHLSAA